MIKHIIVMIALLICWPAVASDHADPIRLSDPLEPGLTGLFVFRDHGNSEQEKHNQEKIVVILNTYRGLSFDAPFYLEPFEYQLHFDWHTPVDFTDSQANARYGGKVITPETVKADAIIKFQLDNDANLKAYDVSGFTASDDMKLWSGVRDDPFIFPRFFGTNVISMVVEIPLSILPENTENLLVWGTSHKIDSGKQLDIVGRSNRTQLARLDFLNKLAPNEQSATLSKKRAKAEKNYDRLKRWLPPLASLYELVFMVRAYDVSPDVVIYSLNRPDGFPNGRLLEDDVAELTCQWGDCALYEVSYIEGDAFPRATKNDKDFLSEFPYLAEPWPSTGHAPDHTHFHWSWLFIALLICIGIWWYVRRKKH